MTIGQSSSIKTIAAKNARAAGVTVLELLVAVTLISFIILALYQMFDKTQEQLRRAMAQVDTLENGRAIMNMMQRDLGKVTVPPYQSTNFTFYSQDYLGTNGLIMQYLNADGSTNTVFTNSFDRLLFLTDDQSLAPNNWGAVGYHIGQRDDPSLTPTNGVGTLYRFGYNLAADGYLRLLANEFFLLQSTQYMARIADNIVHFKVRAYPTNGFTTRVRTVPYWENTNVSVGNFVYSVTNKTLPSLVEVELGYVDEETAETARGFGSRDAATNYLSQIPQKVNLFRFIVPVTTLQ